MEGSVKSGIFLLSRSSLKHLALSTSRKSLFPWGSSKVTFLFSLTSPSKVYFLVKRVRITPSPCKSSLNRALSGCH